MHPLFSTAVLVFVRNEQEEARLKSFHQRLGVRARLQVVRTFNRHITQVTRQSGLPFFIIKGEQQVGANFGERFSNAIESVFAAGFENVVAVGNDCLSLTSKHLQRIATLLEQDTPLVLGPAKDGGVYTIGLKRSAYHRATFINFPWQTESVLTSLITYAQKQRLDCYYLAPATDVDDAVSFQKALSSLATTTYLYKVLKNIIHSVGSQPVADIPFIAAKYSATALLRAPPFHS